MRSILHLVRASTLGLLVSIGLGATAGGCTARTTGASVPEPAPLIVRNDGYFDITVYAVAADGSRRLRLGTVTGNTTARLALRRGHLQYGKLLTVLVHPIGTKEEWMSAQVAIENHMTPILDVVMTPAGGCYLSMLRIVDESLPISR